MKIFMMHIFRLIIFLSFSNVYFAQEIIRIGVGEWPPYVSEEMEDYGLAPKIVTESFALVDIKVEYFFYPWKRAYVSAEYGELDATLLWVKTPEREKVFVFSDVLVSGTAVFFHLKKIPFSWKKLEDLKEYRIGGLRSATYPWFEKAREAGIPLTMDLVTHEVLNFRKLLANHIDIFSLDVFTAYSILNNQFTPEERELITYYPKIIEKWEYCLLISKKYPENLQLVSRFNQGLRILRNTGRYQEILSEYQMEVETEQ